MYHRRYRTKPGKSSARIPQ